MLLGYVKQITNGEDDDIGGANNALITANINICGFKVRLPMRKKALKQLHQPRGLNFRPS